MGSDLNDEPISAGILIADAHEIFRCGLRSVLEARPGWRVVGETQCGRQAIGMAETLRPDIVVVDLDMSSTSGLEAVRRLSSDPIGVRVLAISEHMAAPVTRKVRRAGAAALLAKNEPPERFVATVEGILRGAPFFASREARRDVAELNPCERIPVQFLLSNRELDVLRLLAEGLSNKNIARELGIGIRTAEVYRAGIFARVNARSLGALVRRAIRDGAI
jgi:DNA-binding NarL/FixJ family response regulator